MIPLISDCATSAVFINECLLHPGLHWNSGFPRNE
jgi:hypothetical protein